MPPYIVEPTLSQGPVAGQQNQLIITIPAIIPGVPAYSFGRIQGYGDAPNQGADVGETLAVGAGRQFAVRSFAGFNQNSGAIGFEITFGTAPTTYSIDIQGAYNDLAAEYFDFPATIINSNIATPHNPFTQTDSAAGPIKGTIALGQERVNFIRFNIGVATGGSTVVCKFIM